MDALEIYGVFQLVVKASKARDWKSPVFGRCALKECIVS